MHPRNQARAQRGTQQRAPQKSLFGAESGIARAVRWFDGASIDYLGQTLQLKLDTDRKQPMREEGVLPGVLHLPLPPNATERQIQDAAESWLRNEAELLFSHMIAAEVKKSGLELPALSLSFSVRGSWTQVEAHMIRVNWRLIEQPLSVVDLTLRRAVAALSSYRTTADLF